MRSARGTLDVVNTAYGPLGGLDYAYFRAAGSPRMRARRSKKALTCDRLSRDVRDVEHGCDFVHGDGAACQAPAHHGVFGGEPA